MWPSPTCIMKGPPNVAVAPAQAKGHRLAQLGLVSLVAILFIIYTPIIRFANRGHGRGWISTTAGRYDDPEKWCSLADAIAPPDDDGLKSGDRLLSDEQRLIQVERLAEAVAVPTESFDDNGDVDEDPRWATFDRFHNVLERTFMLV